MGRSWRRLITLIFAARIPHSHDPSGAATLGANLWITPFRDFRPQTTKMPLDFVYLDAGSLRAPLIGEKHLEYPLVHGLRLLSAHTLSSGERIWIITEGNRSSARPSSRPRNADGHFGSGLLGHLRTLPGASAPEENPHPIGGRILAVCPKRLGKRRRGLLPLPRV